MRYRWSDEEHNVLMKMLKHNATLEDINKVIPYRTAAAIQAYLMEKGLQAKPKTPPINYEQLKMFLSTPPERMVEI